MTGDLVDLLLLNISNYPQRPIYPYAFVQLRALAKRHGISVASYDFFGQDKSQIAFRLQQLLSQPRMVGIHLRQADSVCFKDYADLREPVSNGYFPLQETKWLVDCIRELTGVPIVIGGFGFTTHASEIFEYLNVDFGVRGEPDGFFKSFDRLIEGNGFDNVTNLIYRGPNGAILTPREFAPPLDEREYDDETLIRMERFYASSYLYGSSPPTTAVELARGCPYSCYFCTEPSVKGRTVQERNLDVVMEDVAFLHSRGIWNYWLVCSELNIGNADLACRVAERFIRFNESRTAPSAHWHAYHLPRWLTSADLKLLYRSGFRGGWNDFPSLCDDNLKLVRAPYRSKHVVTHLADTMAVQTEAKQDAPSTISFFLGNAYSTPQTVRRTLQRFAEVGLEETFEKCEIGWATRLFRCDGDRFPPPSGASAAATWTHSGRTLPVNTIHPTFYRSAALVRAAGDEEALFDFFDYAESTLLSAAYRNRLDWCQFLGNSADRDWLHRKLSDRAVREASTSGLDEPTRSEVERLLQWVDSPSQAKAALSQICNPRRAADWQACNITALILTQQLMRPTAPQLTTFMHNLGIETDERGRPHVSNYRLLVSLLALYDDNDLAIEAFANNADAAMEALGVWQFRQLLYERNIVLKPSYRRILLADPQ
jgi:hypothetical protein